MRRQIYIACALKAFSTFFPAFLSLDSLMRVHSAIRFPCEMLCFILSSYAFNFYVIMLFFKIFVEYYFKNVIYNLSILHYNIIYIFFCSFHSQKPMPSLLYNVLVFALFIFIVCARFLFCLISWIGTCYFCCCCCYSYWLLIVFV